MTRLWSRLFTWLWARWERAGDRWQDACEAIGYDEEEA